MLSHFESVLIDFEKQSKDNETLIEIFRRKQEMKLYEIRFYFYFLNDYNDSIFRLQRLYTKEKLPQILKHESEWADRQPFSGWFDRTEKSIRNIEEMDRICNILKSTIPTLPKSSQKEPTQIHYDLITGLVKYLENVKIIIESIRGWVKEKSPTLYKHKNVEERTYKLLERVEKLHGYHE